MQTFILRPLTLLLVSLLLFGPIVYLTGQHSVLSGFNLRNYALLMAVYALMSLAAALVRKLRLLGRNSHASFILSEVSSFFVSSIHIVTFLLAFNLWTNYQTLARVHEFSTATMLQHGHNALALLLFYLALVALAKFVEIARKKTC
ncbi:hypothetical protein [Desulfocurvibacter africanus]|uniref:Uncharacterized protein n=1 Tax=Desulfocurvibacter africanus subsp. africanus str. Walvis Bay TaxID=690850 RepID=F3YUV7_DESAF|nr:hypothetical protein [Desulfocurvibacter africanus]EGJ49134.1 hypothetical protein Desaf_0783 [Desulfocurvibacter africanus subsp. africanus str. Walvis Bay]